MAHPENASEEELKAFTERAKKIKEMAKNLAVLTDGVSLDSGRRPDDIARGYYQENMILSSILEAFVYKPQQEFKDITSFVFNYSDRTFIDEVPITFYYHCLAKLCVLEMIEIVKEDKTNPVFAITQEGWDAMRQQSFANLAQTALFNMQTQDLNKMTFKLNKRAVRQNWMMLIVAVASAVAAIVSVALAMRG